MAVEGASLPSINDFLRAYGKFDVAEGTFSVYSEVKVHNGRIDGYVKPLFKDIKVYDPQQDKKKPVLKKLYEKIVGGVSHLLENHPREQVATVADLSGTIDDPNTSTWEIFVRLVSNAFVKAILPGFDGSSRRRGSVDACDSGCFALPPTLHRLCGVMDSTTLSTGMETSAGALPGTTARVTARVSPGSSRSPFLRRLKAGAASNSTSSPADPGAGSSKEVMLPT